MRLFDEFSNTVCRRPSFQWPRNREIETYNWLMLPVTVNFSIGFMAAATVNTAGQAKKGRFTMLASRSIKG